jgi:hypothetical protein|tara:strand:+ start:211 stop:789 length:579 start_codon:yes stop_codon:yes gene_type:complete
MKTIPSISFKLLIFFSLIASCTSEYKALVKKELNKNQKVDSVFFDIRLGESKDIYHKKSWDLNNSRVVTQGRSYFYMKKIFSDSKIKKKENDFALEFSGKFNAKKKLKMLDVKFYHLLWTPWYEKYQAPNLLPRILDSLVRWFPGNPFLEIKTGSDSIPTMHVKIDGDRRFRVYVENLQDVAVKIDDLNEDN